MAADGASGRLDLLKTLGDNTRYAIYLELARSPRPLSTSEVAETLDLHANTVRPHLERMRDVGLLEVRPAAAGGVGRPQHLYSLAPNAPGLGLEPPVYPVVAGILLAMAEEAGIAGDSAADQGRLQGRMIANRSDRARPCLDAAYQFLADFGFDPEVVDTEGDNQATIAFTHCPFADLAESNPELVCSLHRGLLEGFVEHADGTVVGFNDRSHREPCLASISSTGDGP
jgi:predicted ArsR family transcriptional regulator